MDGNKSEGHRLTLGAAGHLPGILANRVPSRGMLNTAKQKLAGLGPVITILALVSGVLLGATSEALSSAVTSAASAFMDGYSFGAPVLIFVVLAPVLSRIFSARREGSFGVYVMGWMAASKVLAMLLAVAFTIIVFRLPIVPEHALSAGDAFVQTSRTILKTLTSSYFFWAIYAAILVGILGIKFVPISRGLEKGVSGVEYAGQYIQPLIPLFMFAVGVYVQALPGQLEAQIGLEGTITSFQTVYILGFQMDPNTTGGMVAVYVAGALLVAAGCFIWQFGILALAKYRDRRFSVKEYFFKYWVKAYPLLWSTSSESLATPLNLYILKTNAPYVKSTVRRLVAGAGSVLCTHGTLICVFILLGVVGSVLGLRFSLLELLLCIPIAFLISFGIPGIPGELLLFAGPLAVILAISPEITPLFLALYLGLQIGLPDSFRTGANATNNYLYCILLNKTYEKRFMGAEPPEEKNQ